MRRFATKLRVSMGYEDQKDLAQSKIYVFNKNTLTHKSIFHAQ